MNNIRDPIGPTCLTQGLAPIVSKRDPSCLEGRSLAAATRPLDSIDALVAAYCGPRPPVDSRTLERREVSMLMRQSDHWS